MLRALMKKIERSAQDMKRKKELKLCLTELLEESGEDEEYSESTDWISIVDRGGLNHITNNMFMLMCSLEVLVKHHIDVNVHPDKEVLKLTLLTSKDVEGYMDDLGVNWREEDRKLILSMLVDHYITVRGFAYCSTFMEKYKTSSHKKVQKSKGIRKTVMGSTSTEDNMQ